ncbi:MAG TPA: hypothetical protein VMA75_02175 [Candidatus Paceibacterota bacterium]|nr:hypothetical protein [Candidatus Paceibacterota bacterium]
MKFVHYKSNAIVDGIALEAGDVLRATDVYDSTSGKWSPIPPALVGTAIVKEAAAVFVRPSAEGSN